MIKKIPLVDTDYLIYVCDNCKKEERAQVTDHGSQVKPKKFYSLAVIDLNDEERFHACSKKCFELIKTSHPFLQVSL